jgi:hypothetical protein
VYFAPRGLMTISTPMDVSAVDEAAGRMEAAASYVRTALRQADPDAFEGSLRPA